MMLFSASVRGMRDALRANLRLVGGAMGLTLLSRVLGLARESVIVAYIGVHDYTDAYFAVSSIVLWLQNWAFGAFTLYFVPRYLALPAGDREVWYRSLLRRAGGWGVLAMLAFVTAYSWIEGLMLGGRNVLAQSSSLMLAGCIPLTVAAGVMNARLISEPAGILAAAKRQVTANLVGLASLVVLVHSDAPAEAVLPATLLVTQGATFLLLLATTRRAPCLAPEASGRHAGSGQGLATTAENVGFNLNAIAQQAIAGALPVGAVTMNAYAVRFILVPLTGLLQPIQQRLLIAFATRQPATGREALRVTLVGGLVAGLLLGVTVGAGLHLSEPLWSAEWQRRFSEHHFALVLMLYAWYAGVVFSNQALARYLFAQGHGWSYTRSLFVAYGAGIVLKVVLTPGLGILVLPLVSIAVEGAVTMHLWAGLSRARVSSLALGAE